MPPVGNSVEKGTIPLKRLDIEQIEVDLLVEAIYQRYGYDFRHYNQASIKRRLRHHLAKIGREKLADLIPDILYNPDSFKALFFDLSVTVTEMFRDPWFFLALREKVFPFLRTFPFINVWQAGCATGEEVYSLAIMLKEEGLYKRTRIYATDFNDGALAIARNRIYPIEKIKEYSSNYQKAGGRHSLADYYQARYESIIIDPSLLENITFANHNLAIDGVFAEVHLILCRNVLIYFNQALQNRVFSIFRDSLCYNGFLCLGSKESVRFSQVKDNFNDFSSQEKIYQSKYKKRATGSLVG